MTPTTTRSRVPAYAFFEITEACNLRCRHCEADAGRVDPAQLTTDEALDVAAQLAAAGCRQVNLTGGEPLVRGDWERIARRFADLGVEVTLATNGTLLDEVTIERLLAAGVRNVAVSLDGDRERHDALRSAPGASGSPFDRAVKALSLRERGEFRSLVDEHEGGMDTDVQFSCAECKHEWRGELPVISMNFFFPSARRRS